RRSRLLDRRMIDRDTPQVYPLFLEKVLLWRITPRVPRRIPQVISASSKISCGVWLPFPIRRSRLNWTPRSKRSDGGRSDLPLPATLQTQRIRKPFLPPSRSPQQKSTAFPRSVIRRTEIYPRQSMDCREWRDCYIAFQLSHSTCFDMWTNRHF